MHKSKLTKQMLHSNLTESGLVLPKLTSSICNMNYLVRVKDHLEYCPQSEEIRKIIYPELPPKKLILLEIIQKELVKKGDKRVVTFDEKHLPDVDWCLNCVFALNPQHAIFNPSFIPTKD